MIRTMLPLALLLIAFPAAAEETKPIVFDVLLPATAALEIDGYKTKSTGEFRSFETPAVAVGKRYSYTLKATDGKKQVTRAILLKTEGKLVVDLRKDFALLMPSPMGGDGDKPPKGGKTSGPTKPGFVTYIDDGRLWVFREASKELAAFQKDGDHEKHVTRIVKGKTIKAPDAQTITAFDLQTDGFEVFVDKDQRLWVFKASGKEVGQYKKDGDLEKHVSRIKGGPNGMTIKAPDYATIDAYLKSLPK